MRRTTEKPHRMKKKDVKENYKVTEFQNNFHPDVHHNRHFLFPHGNIAWRMKYISRLIYNNV